MAICFRSKNIDPQIHSNGPSKYKNTRHKQPLTFLFPVYIDPEIKVLVLTKETVNLTILFLEKLLCACMHCPWC